MTLLYLAGPYRSPLGIWGVKRNIETAATVARQLWAAGYAVICPHLNTALMDGPDVQDEIFLKGDLVMLRRCDGIVMLPGWERSRGSKDEVYQANRAGLKLLKWDERSSSLVDLPGDEFCAVYRDEEKS